MKLKPYGTALTIRPFKEKKITSAGIYIPEHAKSMEVIIYAEVIEVGPGWYSIQQDKTTPLPVKPGDIVAMPQDFKMRPVEYNAIVIEGVNFPKMVLTDIGSVMGTMEFESPDEREGFISDREGEAKPPMRLVMPA